MGQEHFSLEENGNGHGFENDLPLPYQAAFTSGRLGLQVALFIVVAHAVAALWLVFEESVTAIRDRLRALGPDGERGRKRICIADMRALENPLER